MRVRRLARRDGGLFFRFHRLRERKRSRELLLQRDSVDDRFREEFLFYAILIYCCWLGGESSLLLCTVFMTTNTSRCVAWCDVCSEIRNASRQFNEGVFEAQDTGVFDAACLMRPGSESTAFSASVYF